MALRTLISIAKTKAYSFLYKTVLYRFGYGAGVTKRVWEKEYGGTEWDFLFSDDEKAHNLLIINQIKKRGAALKLLDIGCGPGVLYSYLSKSLTEGFDYLGIDISENAIKKANDSFKGAKFKVINYDFESVNERYNIVILNEVLYYFNKPLKGLHKVFEENLLPGGVVIVSMYTDEGGKNQRIWNVIDNEFNILDEDTVTNDKGTSWKVKTIGAK